MSSFLNDYMNKNTGHIINSTVLKLIASISEYKGKQGLYEQQSPEILKKLQDIATIQSTESSNRIEGIFIKNQRLQELMKETTTPENRPENEVAAYRSVLSQIHSAATDIPIRPNIIKQLHQMLHSFSPGEGGAWKFTDNEITEKYPDGTVRTRFKTTPAILTEDSMKDLCKYFSLAMEEKDPHELILIAAFVLDFLCIHPFRDGNGRMARLLTLLCLYHAGYNVGRFISLEKIIEETKETYYSTLYQSSQGWHEGNHDLLPWLEYFLGIILKAYRELESRVGIVSESRGQKTERVREIVLGFLTPFSVREIENRCPDIKRPTINATLKAMREEGLIELQGFGRSAKWKIIYKDEIETKDF
ncbi:Fic family protein [Aneurinibacillus tyrosinisolvens]|uniref:Fic family protein n=1 Tax=Aneurinibacillus tyrosinisolvens TaxID=1443435 RepID=UPI00063F974E|nr:Fic family protein [Aneurinibacillus tyrosinisolvens]